MHHATVRDIRFWNVVGSNFDETSMCPAPSSRSSSSCSLSFPLAAQARTQARARARHRHSFCELACLPFAASLALVNCARSPYLSRIAIARFFSLASSFRCWRVFANETKSEQLPPRNRRPQQPYAERALKYTPRLNTKQEFFANSISAGPISLHSSYRICIR